MRKQSPSPMIRSLLTALAAGCLLAGPAMSESDNVFPRDSFGDIVLPLPLWLQSEQNEGYNPYGEPKLTAVTRFGKTSAIARAGRPVGRLDVATGTGVMSCTGFLVSADLLLTTALCAQGKVRATSDGPDVQAIRFTLGYLDKSDPESAEVFDADTTPVEIDETLHYAVLRISSGKPGDLYGTLALARRAPLDFEPLWLLGHPFGFPQHVAREDCWSATPALLDGNLRHSCDNLPGNQGSPLVDTQENRVIGMHFGGFRTGVQHAIPMRRILDSSSVLKPADQD
ncbi:serine protease [Mameliella sp. CS4]|uniref:trypsin-like serine peptidase n=2 Tax=Mameliella TaxID=1434019 RepID=UPI001C5D46D7|nr:serine protease [Mameliella sp. CS4]MBW4981745.1 serine protease [Mameliella sp. CS4]